MNRAACILLLLILPSLACAVQCNGNATISVPAVVGDGSGLVEISLRLTPGNGGVYLSTSPQTGTSTQQSVEDAVQYALGKAGLFGCDAIIGIDSGSATYVEGPSAGAATAVLVYSVATHSPIRRDAIMTGSVDKSGKIGSVGGLYEKSLAAAAADFEYFVTPKNSFFDILLLRNVQSSENIKILEAQTVDEAIGFMLENKSLPEPSFDRKPEPIPDASSYDSLGMEGFSNVAASMISLGNRTVSSLPAGDAESDAIISYYSAETANQAQILDKGYLFTAANEAFLRYIEVSTVAAVLFEDHNLNSKQSSITNCLASLPAAQKTDSNFQWLVGADLRRTWAENRINSTDISKADDEILEAKYVVYHELMYADAWCKVSGLLSDAAGDGGAPLNESAWKMLAEKKLSEARKLKDPDADMNDHLASAQLSLDKGRYGAALFDSIYVIATAKAKSDMDDMMQTEIKSETREMLAENRTSLWGTVYRSHAAWLAAQNVSASSAAFSTLRYARALDEITSQMVAAAASASQPVSGQSEPASQAQVPDCLDQAKIIAVLLIFLIVLLLFYISTKKAYSQGLSDGTVRGTQGSRYVSRAKQSKGRDRIQA